MNKLKAVIERAVENGWVDTRMEVTFHDDSKAKFELDSEFELLFSHDFAKAFFGEGMIYQSDLTAELKKELSYIGSKGRCLGVAWKYHIGSAVLSEDPLEYYFNQL